MKVVVHMTPCTPSSTVASARVARFISGTLSIPLVDSQALAVEMLHEHRSIDELIIVNGPMAFCDFLSDLAELVRRARKVVWVQQDYTIRPPASTSKAESPFRKVFAERNLRPVFWTTCEKNVVTDEDKYINWNQLTYDPVAIQEQRNDTVLYYGAFREKRLSSFHRYFALHNREHYKLAISSTTRSTAKWCAVAGNTVTLVPPMHSVIAEAGKYAAALYIEDDLSHRELHSPANRFYEMLSAGTPLLFDHLCTPQLARAGIHVPARWIVEDGTTLAAALQGMNPVEVAGVQRAMWHRDYVGDLKNRLLEIAQ